MPYNWDVFISYCRAGNVTDWVQNHLHPVLVKCLADELADPPQVFLDRNMEVGAHWPEELAEALRASRVLLAVWSPRYFTSSWCVGEWQSMLARQKRLGIPRSGERHGLIYPVTFSDGASFPREALEVQSCLDLSPYGFPYPQFSRTEAYLEFHKKVRGIAVDLVERFTSAPPWEPDWPVLRPGPYSVSAPLLPRLGAA